MAEFMSELQGRLRPSYSSFSFLDNPIPLTPLCNETNFFFFPNESPLLQPLDVTGVVPAGGVVASSDGCLGGGDGNNNSNDIDINRNKKKKKTLGLSQGSCSASAKSSGDPVKRRKHHGTGGGGGGRGKKIKGDEGEEEDGGRKEVVHVRARRGQATDSHSLAERVRRGKINERLRCLQDIVPGCYKTMGLAVMLDEIINYVQSLQNQVEFLSMKLTAASSFYDFNSESDLIDVMRRAKAYEAKEAEKLPKRGQLEGHSANTTTTNTTTTTTTSNLISTFHPFDHIL